MQQYDAVNINWQKKCFANKHVPNGFYWYENFSFWSEKNRG